ncbi:MAG: SIMPL domain-containing protein [Thermoflexaceae bacterium]|nr:SIMPL domain-containing protein [Thermoflexaceae bacterium]
MTVTGHGEAHVAPDTGYFEVGVQVMAATVEAARDRAATFATAVIASIKQNGVDSKDVQTTNLNIQPQYDYSKNSSTPTITGYIVTNTVTVTVRSWTRSASSSTTRRGPAATTRGCRACVSGWRTPPKRPRRRARRRWRTRARRRSSWRSSAECLLGSRAASRRRRERSPSTRRESPAWRAIPPARRRSRRARTRSPSM